jgi:hypothetical protein
VKKTIVVSILFVFLLSSCSKEKQEGSVLIRVENETGQRALEVSITSLTTDGQQDLTRNYGTIETGTSSSYQHHELIYNFPLYTIYLEGFGKIDQSMIPCAIGLSQITSGKYALKIGMDSNNYPYINFVKD